MKPHSLASFEKRKKSHNKSEMTDYYNDTNILDKLSDSTYSNDIELFQYDKIKPKNPNKFNFNDVKIGNKSSLKNLSRLKVRFQEELPSNIKKQEITSPFDYTNDNYSNFNYEDDKNKATQSRENIDPNQNLPIRKESESKRQYYYDLSILPMINNKKEEKNNRKYYSDLYASHWKKMKQYSNNLMSTHSKSAFYIDQKVFESQKFNNYLEDELSKKINIKFKKKGNKSANTGTISYVENKDISPSFDQYQIKRIVKEGKTRLQPIKLVKQKIGLEILSKKMFELFNNE
jgi:hypothetical protein